jgi:hypothetical protein
VAVTVGFMEPQCRFSVLGLSQQYFYAAISLDIYEAVCTLIFLSSAVHLRGVCSCLR